MSAFNTSWTSALSMTLLHSLWQGLAITMLTAFVLKASGVRNSSGKYLIKTGAFFILVASSAITFFILLQPASEITTPSAASTFTLQQSTASAASVSYFNLIINYLQAHQLWIVLGWAAGTFLFSLRFAAGIAYLKYLRVHALPADNAWSNSIKNLSAKLGIDRVVQLYESVQVQTPIAMGYLKPVILMPIGLMAGLSTQQVEVILIHELEHIRRHDYLINFIQSLGETIFFFNPFVWILSAWIRDERENCCDDAVLREGYDPRLYATTLYELESARLEHAGLALALTGNKNQLLNRIKRIMEHSAKNQKGKEKFIPLALVVLGLVFASWLSINPKEAAEVSAKKIAANDTTVNPKTKSVSYSRKSVMTYDKDGKPHEEIVEDFNGDEELRGLTAPQFDFDMANMPEPAELADIEDLIDIPEIGEIHSMMAPLQSIRFDMVPSPVVAFPSSFRFDMDTLPDMIYFKSGMDEERMKEFEANFKNEFKQKFGDFYAKNQAEMDRVMANVQAKMAKMDEQMAFEMARIAPIPAIPDEAMHDAELAQLHAMEEMRLSDSHRKVADEQMRRHEADAKVMEERMQQFEKELTVLLISDGYLKKGTKMDGVNFNFTDDGISVNGQKIKTADEPKYRKLNHKYFGESVRHRPE